MRKYLIAGVIGALVIIIAAYLIFFRQSGNAFKAIPGNAALVLETRSFTDLFNRLDKTSTGKVILQTTLFTRLQDELTQVNAAVANNSAIKNSLSQHSSLASVHLTQADDYEFLFATYAANISEGDIEQLASKKPGTLSKHVFKGENIFEIKLDNGRTLSLAKVEGILLVSFAPFLTEGGAEALLTGDNILSDKNFKQVKKAINLTEGLALYANYSKMPSLMPVILRPDKLSLFSGLRGFGEWTGGIITCTDEKIELTGITALTDKEDEHWQNENVLEYSLLEKIPDNACYVNISAQIQGEAMLKAADNSNAAYVPYFSEWAGMQSAFITLEALKEDYTEQNAFIVKVDDKTKAILKLRGYMREGGVAIQAIDTFMTAEILHLEKGDIINKVFGGGFNKITNPYFALHSDVLIFTNNIDALKLIIEKLSRKETLNKTIPAYTGPAERFVYLNPARASLFLKGLFNEEGGVSADRFMSSFTHVSATMHKEGMVIKTKVVLETGITIAAPTGLIWKTKLRAFATTAPKLVYDNNSKDYMVFVQDTLGNAMLLDKSGEQAWTKNFTEPVISQIYQLDYYNNGVYYYLFNTANKVYIVDSRGEDIDGFPLRLSSQASAGLTLLNYDNRNVYRFFVPCANGTIYGYEGNGRPLAGWNPRTSTGILNYPMGYFVYNNADYLLTQSTQGSLIAMDRKGISRFSLQNLPAYNQPFSIVKTADGFSLLNASGSQLIVIDKTGNDNTKQLIDSAVTFTAANVTDSTYIYVFATNNIVRMYDSKDNFKYSGQINGANISSLQVLDLAGTKCIRADDASAKKIYLFDMKLKPAFVETISYGGGALICHVGGTTGTISLVTTADGYLEARRIKQ